MKEEYLPFGQTQTTRNELDDLTNSEVATSLLEDRGVANSTAKVDSFLDQLPALLEWLETNGREYPWRVTTDPWRIYISEILLQRTRGDAVEEVYDTFFNHFPDPESLHLASDKEIYERVSPLGFGNQRTRTLKEVAELCYVEYGGKVPRELEELKRPWRVGPYSARACLLFAFDNPQALVDTNIARIVERVFSYDMPTQPHKSDEVYEFMESLTPRRGALARSFNLALLDLGDLICTNSSPMCSQCPLNTCCVYASNRSL